MGHREVFQVAAERGVILLLLNGAAPTARTIELEEERRQMLEGDLEIKYAVSG